MEFTKMRRGFDQAFGASSDFSSQVTFPVQTTRSPLRLVSPLYFSTPMASRGAAMRIA
jgi:hypothetical protein